MSSDDEHGEEWVSDLFGQHSRSVLAYARRRLDSAEDAEDVVVEVFATAWRRRADVPDNALPWLYATAANVIAHVIRSEARRSRLGARLAAVRPLHDPDLTEGVVEATTAHATIAAALDDLAEADAELLRLWAWEGLEPAEIAEVLGISPGTARTRMHRARGRLREALRLRGVSGPGVDGFAEGDTAGPAPAAPGAAAQGPADPAPGHPTPSTTTHGSEAAR